MEYLIMFLALAAILLAVFLLEAVRARREEKKFVRSLYEDFGKLREREYPPERFIRMDSYFRRHPEEGQIDDITWNDLGMDDIFKEMNHTFSAAGEEYLYYTLRSPRQDRAQLDHLEKVVRYFKEHPDERVRVQLVIRTLGYTGKFSLYEYLENLDFLGERSNRMSILRDFLFLPLIALLWFNVSLGIMAIVVLVISNIVSYFKEKNEIDPYIVSFAYVMRLLDTCDKLQRLSIPVCLQEWESMKVHKKSLQAMRRNSFWVMSPGRGGQGGSGNPLEILMDYIRMVFHVDLIKFNRMLKHLRGHIEDVDALIGIVGFLETAVSILAFRISLEQEYCLPEFLEEIGIEESAHSDIDIRQGGDISLEEGFYNSISTRERGSTCLDESLHSSISTRKGGSTSLDEVHSHAEGGTCLCGHRSIEFEMEQGYHPLLINPVKNSISTKRGVLLTGSNASGKSTFLKTAALNAILAQTIHTCMADAYRAPLFYVYSSMTLRDDIEGGESYYIVEIKALKRILDAAVSGQQPILCFVDEVLRGTNTVERIAASTQILKSLGGSGILCFAATHDIELTDLLRDEFDNYHFEEDVREGDVVFNYKLLPGKATTRNAIKLLELMGYAPEIIQKANAQAEHFMETGEWERCLT